MKRFLMLFVFITVFLCQPVLAETIRVQALEDFSTENPLEYMSVKAMDDLVLDEDLSIKSGCVIKGQVVDVKSPKRLKRNATFKFIPLSYTDESGQVTDINGYYPAKYTTKLNKGELAKSAALTVGSYFVKGLSLGYSAIEGAVKNEKDNRFKSSVNEVYEDSPFSYVEKGKDIVIKKEQMFLLNFKAKGDPDEDDEEEDAPNYEYEQLPVEQDKQNVTEDPASLPSDINPELLKDTNSDVTRN